MLDTSVVGVVGDDGARVGIGSDGRGDITASEVKSVGTNVAAGVGGAAGVP